MPQTSATDGRDSYRYERKFIVPAYLFPRLPDLLQNSIGRFQEVFSERIVNNVYYDTPQFRFFNENRQGYPYRDKVRVRWYGHETCPKQMQLEIKRRSGLVGTKEVYYLKKPIQLWQPRSFEEIHHSIQDLPPAAHLALAPMLYNTYSRRYFLSEDSRFRVTIDYNLRFNHPNALQRSHLQPPLDDIILELKYAHQNDTIVDRLSSEWPFRLAKKSKYVSGVCALYSIPE